MYSEVKLINYTSSVEFFTRDYKYSNGKKVKDLKNKLWIMCKKMPNEVLKTATKGIVDIETEVVLPAKYTRDYLIHGDHLGSKYVYNDYRIIKLNQVMKRIIEAFILNYLKMPVDLIRESMSWMYYTNIRVIDVN